MARQSVCIGREHKIDDLQYKNEKMVLVASATIIEKRNQII